MSTKTVMLSRLEKVRLAPKRKAKAKTAVERLRDRLYRKYPPALLVSELERQDKDFWKWVSSPLKVRRREDQ